MGPDIVSHNNIKYVQYKKSSEQNDCLIRRMIWNTQTIAYDSTVSSKYIDLEQRQDDPGDILVPTLAVWLNDELSQFRGFNFRANFKSMVC